MAEVLAPTRLDITTEFQRGFAGLKDTPVTIDELTQAREDLIAAIVGDMPQEHRRFPISVKEGRPDWSLLELPGAEKLPAIRWNLENLAKLEEGRGAALLARLREVLGIGD